jgi:E3 ubiquitin-protein ligase UBR4
MCIVMCFVCLDSSKDILMSHISSSSVVASLLDLVKILMPAVEASCKRHSPVGCHQRAQTALRELHTLEKRFENTDQLMVRKLPDPHLSIHLLHA